MTFGAVRTRLRTTSSSSPIAPAMPRADHSSAASVRFSGGATVPSDCERGERGGDAEGRRALAAQRRALAVLRGPGAPLPPLPAGIGRAGAAPPPPCPPPPGLPPCGPRP